MLVGRLRLGLRALSLYTDRSLTRPARTPSRSFGFFSASDAIRWVLLPRAMAGVVALLCANAFIVGINQIYDVKIDEVNKPYLPIAAGEMSQVSERGRIAEEWIAVGTARKNGSLTLPRTLSRVPPCSWKKVHRVGSDHDPRAPGPDDRAHALRSAHRVAVHALPGHRRRLQRASSQAEAKVRHFLSSSPDPFAC